MNTRTIMARARAVIATSAIALGLGACASLSPKDQNTAIGASAGAIGGAVLTNGSAMGTLGGAAIGGFIGNTIEDNK
jgi:osmotically inducible lipoprotein OsmB